MSDAKPMAGMGSPAHSLPKCEFFQFIGSQHCDNCGRFAKEHKGMQVLKKGAGPFNNGEDAWENLTWAQWDARVELERQEREARDGPSPTHTPEEIVEMCEAIHAAAEALWDFDKESILSIIRPGRIAEIKQRFYEVRVRLDVIDRGGPIYE